MTKEQAINVLKENLCSLYACGSQNMDSCDIRECDNRDYIKALEQQPSDDCVSREQVLYIIKPHIHEIISESGRDLNAHTNGVLRAIIKLVKGMPPVTPTHGTCKDCKHRDPEDKMCDCGHTIQWQLPREDNWYCKDFKKRGNENEVN